MKKKKNGIARLKVCPVSNEHIIVDDSSGGERGEKLGPRASKSKVERDPLVMMQMAMPSSAKTGAFGDHWGSRKTSRSPVMFFGSVGLLIVGVLVIATVGQRKLGGDSQAAHHQKITMEPSLTGVSALSPLELGLDKYSTVVELAKYYLEVEHAEDLIRIIRDPQRVEFRVLERWMPFHNMSASEMLGSSKWSVHNASGTNYGILKCKMPDGSPLSLYFGEQNQRLVLDWEATSGFSDYRFEELAEGKSEGGLARCFISPAEFYTFSFSESEFVSYRLTSPDAQFAIWGYVRRGSEQEIQLGELFKPGLASQHVLPEYKITIRLKKSINSLPNQWLIDSFVNLEWFVP